MAEKVQRLLFIWFSLTLVNIFFIFCKHLVGHGCMATVGSYRWFALPKSRCIIGHLEGPECVVSFFQSTQLQLLCKTSSGPRGELCFSSSAVRQGLLCFSAHGEHCWALGPGHCLCHGAVGGGLWALSIQPLNHCHCSQRQGCGVFLLLVHLHKGRILNWKFSDFWPDSCDPHLERSSYINNKLFFQLFFKFTFSYFLWLPWAHDLHLPYCMQRDSLQCFLYLTSLSTKAGSHSVITFRVFFSSFWKKPIWGSFKINGKVWSIEMLWTEAIRW